MFQHSIVIIAHSKKVRSLHNALQRLSRGDIDVIAEFGFVIGNEGFFLDIVPSGVIVQVNVGGGGAAEPEGLGCAFVAGGGGANVIIVGDECSLVEALEAGDVLCSGE